MYISIVVPFHNEELNLPKSHQELMETLRKIKGRKEIIYVDDASTDSSVEKLKASIKENGREKNLSVKIIMLRRKFGQTAAISAGIDQAQGKILVFMDADLQNDPKDVSPMIKKLEQGYDVVVGWRKKRNEKRTRIFVSKAANFMIRLIFKTPFHDIGCSLKIIRKEALKDIRIYGETHRLISILMYWKGTSIYEYIVADRKRFTGKSKYGYSRAIKLILDLITIKFLSSYGTKPAYVFGTFGIISILTGFFLMVIVLYHKIFESVFVHRNPLFLIASFLIMLGIQFLLMGLLAELIVRTYFESQKKPIYEIKSTKVY